MSVSSTHQQEYKKLKRLKITRWFLSAVGLIIIAYGIYLAFGLFLNYQKNESTNDAQVEQYLSPINVKVSGYIEKIYFTEHQFVRKGDTLLIIDDHEYKIRLKDMMHTETAQKMAEQRHLFMEQYIKAFYEEIG